MGIPSKAETLRVDQVEMTSVEDEIKADDEDAAKYAATGDDSLWRFRLKERLQYELDRADKSLVNFIGADYISGGGRDRCGFYPIVSLFALIVSVITNYSKVVRFRLLLARNSFFLPWDAKPQS